MKQKGRPSSFTEELGDLICSLLIEGESLKRICKLERMPSESTVYLWLTNNKAFSEQYTRAREIQADRFGEELFEIADDKSDDVSGELKMPNSVAVQRARLQIDTRKWWMSKVFAKRYGESSVLKHEGGIDLGLADAISKARKRLA